MNSISQAPTQQPIESSGAVLQRRLAMLLIWIIPLFWTINIVVARRAPGIITPNVLALGRWGLAGVIFFALSWQELWQQRQIITAQSWRYIVLGGLGMWICGAWVYLAGQSTSGMNISLIYATAPIMIAVGSYFWLGERFGPRQLFGVALAMAGMVHVVMQGQWQQLSAFHLVSGDILIIIASISWAIYALLQRLWSSTLSATAQLAAISFGGALVTLPFALWEIISTQTPAMSWDAVFMILVTAIFPGVLAYWIYNWAQRVLGASRVAVTLYLGPLYTALISQAVLNEPLHWFHLVGGIMILSGVALVLTRNRN
jgi:drug/metabolite transporter (DMT)-like permease